MFSTGPESKGIETHRGVLGISIIRSALALKAKGLRPRSRAVSSTALVQHWP